MNDANLRPGLVWDWPVRTFHWLLVGAFASAFVTAESESWRHVHVFAGYLAGALVVFRLLWGAVGTRYARFASFWPGRRALLQEMKSLLKLRPPHHAGHNPLGSVAIFAMLALAVLVTISGWLNYQEIGGDAMEDIHEVLANAWLAVIGVHVAGVLLASVAHRENLVGAMITGRKRVLPGEAIASPRAGVALMLLVGMMAFALWYFSRLP